MAWRGLTVACRDLPITFLLSNVWDLAIQKKVTTETLVRRNKFDIVTIIFAKTNTSLQIGYENKEKRNILKSRCSLS